MKKEYAITKDNKELAWITLAPMNLEEMVGLFIINLICRQGTPKRRSLRAAILRDLCIDAHDEKINLYIKIIGRPDEVLNIQLFESFDFTLLENGYHVRYPGVYPRRLNRKANPRKR